MDTLHRGRRWGWLVAVACAALAGCNDSRPPDFVLEQKSMTLTGAQETPPVTTAAMGTGTFSFNLTTGEVKGSLTTTGITGTVAHFHEGPVGVPSPVIVPLVQGPPGTWTAPEGSMLTPSQIESYKAGRLYLNVHSAAHPGGEIRAQVARQVYYATLTQAQETPPTGSAATGTGTFTFDPDTRILSGGVTTTGIAGVAAHLHTAAIGTAGPITIPMTGGPSNWTIPDNTVLTPDQVTTLTSGNFYANVHSAANPGGEIRGQVYVPMRVASMNGAQETPPVATSATGMCWMMVNPVDKTVAGRIETTITNGIAAHAHQASAGVPGPIVIPMTSPSPGVWVTAPGATISDTLLAAFMKGDLYCNVHTAANPGGEIRGQLLTPP